MKRALSLRIRLLVVGLAAVSPLDLAGCAEPKAAGPLPSQSTAAILSPPTSASPAGATSGATPEAQGSAPAAQTSDGGAAATPTAWIEAVRLDRWAEAAALIDALPEAERDKPEIRYVRARAALFAKDAARAAQLLEGLDKKLPVLAEDIARYRAEAALAVGPFGEAAAYFARGTKARDYLRAGEAYEKAGDIASARQMAEKAVTAAERARARREEAAARAMRARLQPKPDGPAAMGDRRWIAVEAPLSAEAAAAREALEQQKQPLVMKEKVRSIEAMIETGGASEAPAAIDKLMAEKGAPKRELLHLRAMALYKARAFAEAVKAFQTAAGAGTGREAEELSYAAKALARSGKDAEAVKLHLAVASRFKATPYGEQSAYLAAQLLLQTGRFKEAVTAYTKYLAAYARGKDRADAEVELALATLSAGDAKVARKQFNLIALKSKGDLVGKVRELEGVAALRAGDKEGAVATWTEVMRTFPLTWAAQTARSRLIAASAPVPPLLVPTPGQAAPAAPPSGAYPAMRVALPPTAALLTSMGLDADAESRLASSEHEAAAAYPGRESEALCEMYGMLSRAKRRYRVGVAAVSYSMLMRAPADTERWAWECLYPRPYADPVRTLEDQHGFPKGILHALMRQESAFDPAVVSPAEAVGLIQLIPPTAMRVASELAVPYDPTALTNPEMNLKLGAHYLKKLLTMFQGSVPLAAAGYNAGPTIVSHWFEVGADNEADLFVARIPYDETRNYVARVAGNLARYQWLSGGDAAVAQLPLEIPASARATSDAY